VWIPPGQKHWHGASSTTAMTHIAIQGAVDGKNVDWMEKFSEEEYKMTDTHKSDALPIMTRDFRPLPRADRFHRSGQRCTGRH
jgi:hypothetical protein